MTFIIGLIAGWIAGSMATVVCAVVVAGGNKSPYEQALDDKAQEEFIRKWNETH